MTHDSDMELEKKYVICMTSFKIYPKCTPYFSKVPNAYRTSNPKQSMMPAYFVSEREKFLQKCKQMRFYLYVVADFID